VIADLLATCRLVHNIDLDRILEATAQFPHVIHAAGFVQSELQGGALSSAM
jgi:hypothetical protein